MEAFYNTTQGDRIDQVVWDHYGSYSMLPYVIEANRHLYELPLALPANVKITLPVLITEDPASSKTASGDGRW